MITSVIKSTVDTLTTDQYVLDTGNRVTIACRNRKPGQVVGVLAEPLSFQASANYEPISFGGTIDKVVDFIGAGANLLTGGTVKQPWFKRQLYKDTNNLTFTVKIAFVAQVSALKEVFEPCVALIGYLYPRKLGTGDLLSLYATPGPNLFTGNEHVATGHEWVEKMYAGASLVKGWSEKLMGVGGKNKPSPGPDPHSLTIGKIMSLKYCYLNSVQVQFSQSLDSDGYPHYAIATCQITTYDNSYADRSGKFVLDQLTPCNLDITQAINEIEGVGSKALDLGKGVIDTVKSAVSGGN